MALLFGEELGGVVAVLVFVDDDMLGRGDKTVLYAAIPTEALLISACVEETDVERLVFLQFGQEDGIGMGVGIVVVLTVTGESAEEHPLVFAIPVVDGKHDETLVDTPSVGQRGDERRVDHVPQLTVVLLLLIHYTVEGGTALAHSKRAELGENIGFVDTTNGADIFYLGKDLLGHGHLLIMALIYLIFARLKRKRGCCSPIRFLQQPLLI